MNYHSDYNSAAIAKEKFSSDDVACIKADITKEAERVWLLDHTKKIFGQCDVLVNNAGITEDGRFLELGFDDYHHIMLCNFYAPIFFAQSFASKLLVEKKGVSIINVLSIGAYGSGNMAYCTSKVALFSATKCMVKELAKYNIRANSISPGTPSFERRESKRISRALGENAEENPYGGGADPSEMPGTVVYLVSDAASYTMGTDIIIDGGMLA